MRRNIEEYQSVLVVEGYSDLLFYAEVLEEVGKHEQVHIEPMGGKSNLHLNLENFVTPSLLAKKDAIAFVFDADHEPEATKLRLEQLLSKVTSQVVVDGSWSAGPPRIGLFIVPGGGQRGEIETLVWSSWGNDPANAEQKHCVEAYIECMAGNGARAHSPDKGLIGALLAIKSDEDPRLGPGARTNIFDLNREELRPLRDFLSGF